MKTLVIDFKETPFAKIKDVNFSKLKYDAIFNTINVFIEDFKDFKNKNNDLEILIKYNTKGPSFPLDFSLESDNTYLKLDNIYYQDTKEYSTLIVRDSNYFSILMTDKSNNNIYLIKNQNSESFIISFFEDKLIQGSFIANFSNGNKSHSLVEIPTKEKKSEQKISNTVFFEKNDIAEFISGTIENGIKSYYIRFNDNKCQMKDILIVDGKIDTINKAAYVYYEIPDHLKKKLASRNKCSLEEMYEITQYLKPKQEFNRLINDDSGFGFCEMDVLLEKIHNIIEENKDRIYFASNDLVNNFKKIISEALVSEKAEVNILKHKSISFYDYSQFNRNEISYPSINLNNIKNIYETLKQDFDSIQNLRSNTLKDNKLKK